MILCYKKNLSKSFFFSSILIQLNDLSSFKSVLETSLTFLEPINASPDE